MKEAIGGTWIFVLVITFLAVFTTFVSVSTNYSRCYKIKDEILLSIERAHGVNTDSIKTINAYLKGTGYSSTGDCPSDGNCWYPFSIRSNSIANGKDANYCITKYTITERTSDENKIYTNGPVGHPESAYYGVVIFFRLDWPIFRQLFRINIDGETSIIYLVHDFDEIENKVCYG